MKKNVSDWLIQFNRKKNHGCTTVSICSGKGGVGKTSICLRMARELAESGYKTLVVDCDYNLSNISLKLGLNFQSKFSSYLENQISLSDCLLRVENFWILPTCNGDWSIFDQHKRVNTELIKILDILEAEYDFILLDCPAGIHKENVNLFAYGQQQIVVLTPDRSSLADAYSMIKILNQRYGISKIHICINQVQDSIQGKRVLHSIDSTVQRFLSCQLNLLGTLPKVNYRAEFFDLEFIFRENNTIYNNFLKIRENFIDAVNTFHLDFAREVDCEKQFINL